MARGGKAGLFPSSFVTSEVVPETPAPAAEPIRSEAVVQKPPTVQVDESVMKRCIELLEQCDPTGETPDDPELAYFEQMSVAQIPLIDQKLAQIDKQHNMLAQIDVAIRDVLASYDNAVQQAHANVRFLLRCLFVAICKNKIMDYLVGKRPKLVLDALPALFLQITVNKTKLLGCSTVKHHVIM